MGGQACFLRRLAAVSQVSRTEYMLLAVDKWGWQGEKWTLKIQVLSVQKMWPADRTSGLVVIEGQRSRPA